MRGHRNIDLPEHRVDLDATEDFDAVAWRRARARLAMSVRNRSAAACRKARPAATGRRRRIGARRSRVNAAAWPAGCAVGHGAFGQQAIERPLLCAAARLDRALNRSRSSPLLLGMRHRCVARSVATRRVDDATRPTLNGQDRPLPSHDGRSSSPTSAHRHATGPGCSGASDVGRRAENHRPTQSPRAVLGSLRRVGVDARNGRW